jgi:hypothetical protein
MNEHWTVNLQKSNYHTVTTTTAVPPVVAFFDLQSVCVQQSTQDHSHQIKFETCEEFLKKAQSPMGKLLR